MHTLSEAQGLITWLLNLHIRKTFKESRYRVSEFYSFDSTIMQYNSCLRAFLRACATMKIPNISALPSSRKWTNDTILRKRSSSRKQSQGCYETYRRDYSSILPQLSIIQSAVSLNLTNSRDSLRGWTRACNLPILSLSLNIPTWNIRTRCTAISQSPRFIGTIAALIGTPKSDFIRNHGDQYLRNRRTFSRLRWKS